MLGGAGFCWDGPGCLEMTGSCRLAHFAGQPSRMFHGRSSHGCALTRWPKWMGFSGWLDERQPYLPTPAPESHPRRLKIGAAR